MSGENAAEFNRLFHNGLGYNKPFDKPCESACNPQIFEETVHSVDGDYMRRWLCEAPALGISFQVLESEWNEDFTVQTIKKVRVHG